jgi:death-on-curing protein
MIEHEGVFYFEVEDALVYHAAVLGCSEEEAWGDLRDEGILRAALQRPINHAYYDEADMALQAATLVHGLIMDHPFVDANKRTAHMIFVKFLSENGYGLRMPERQIVYWHLRIATGNVTVEQYGDLLRFALYAA